LFDDQTLWKKIASGNADAFDAWYRETAPRLRIFLRHLLANEQEAEDVMQETFTQIWHRPHRFDPERGSPRAYLFGVARRQAAEWRRKQKPTDELGIDPPALSRVEIASMVTEAFSRLTREHRTLLWLREVEGQSYQELAMILDVPLGTVRSRLFAAREALRALWRSPRRNSGGRHDL
jgi:RNA polymerase sigma-70 factor (ECF subfamily)